MKDRIEKVYKILNNSNLDAIALVPGSNFRYITGWNFHLMERPTILIITKKKELVAILPSLEVDSFSKLDFSAKVFSWHDKDGYENAFREASNEIGDINRLGVEGQRIRFFETQALSKNFSRITLVNLHKEISSIRLNKDQEEVNYLKKAISISEISLENTLKFIKIGMSELEVKQFLIQQLYINGAEGLSFDPIVLGAENSALPHGHSSEKNKLQKGDTILFDFGGTYKGFNADITRTFFLGEINELQKNVYENVLKANLVGIENSITSNSMHEVDDLTTRVLENGDYRNFIVHKTGHGLGLDLHEDPYVVRGNHSKLEKGMIITVEPGLYIPNKFGIRIEDNVLITDNLPDVLTSFSKKIRIIKND